MNDKNHNLYRVTGVHRVLVGIVILNKKKTIYTF